MKRIITGLFLLMMAGTFGGCHGYRRIPDREDMILQAAALDRRFVKAFSNGDVDRVMAEYWNSPDLVVYPPDAMEAHGWAAVKAGYAQTFKNMPGAQLEIQESNYRVAGDAVIGTGTWKMVIPPPPGVKGEATELRGRFTDVIAKRDGKWVYIIDHPSVPMQPPASQPAK